MQLQYTYETENRHECREFSVRFPEPSVPLEQDEEWCVVKTNGSEKRIRFHDYHKIYEIPGLYEFLFYEKLKCRSPQTICLFLEHELRKAGLKPSDLSVLDLGAGNGVVGEQLREIGVSKLIGVDIIEEAGEAALRDRPDIYNGYYIEDMTDLTPETRARLRGERLNALTIVAALGFQDIPPRAYAESFNLIETPGWVAFNLRDKFLTENDVSGFSRLIERMEDNAVIEVLQRYRYFHRLSLQGKPLMYVAVIGKKLRDIPMEMVQDLD